MFIVYVLLIPKGSHKQGSSNWCRSNLIYHVGFSIGVQGQPCLHRPWCHSNTIGFSTYSILIWFTQGVIQFGHIPKICTMVENETYEDIQTTTLMRGSLLQLLQPSVTLVRISPPYIYMIGYVTHVGSSSFSCIRKQTSLQHRLRHARWQFQLLLYNDMQKGFH